MYVKKIVGDLYLLISFSRATNYRSFSDLLCKRANICLRTQNE